MDLIDEYLWRGFKIQPLDADKEKWVAGLSEEFMKAKVAEWKAQDIKEQRMKTLLKEFFVAVGNQDFDRLDSVRKKIRYEVKLLGKKGLGLIEKDVVRAVEQLKEEGNDNPAMAQIREKIPWAYTETIRRALMRLNIEYRKGKAGRHKKRCLTTTTAASTQLTVGRHCLTTTPAFPTWPQVFRR